jgi:UDP-N-acetylglucosamine--N-acetylmuramyl-(pentapeptide) pyrophosphoryl-undecaprenol N-acetylglucosamine transferase
MARFVMAGGGTGGHVLPLLAVARLLRDRGHEVVFIGTKDGYEARLVPEAGFRIEWIDVGGMKRVGLGRFLRSLWMLPAAVWRCLGLVDADAVFSLGGFVAAPVCAAAILRRVPLVAMEPNAVPGAVNRWCARWVRKALVAWPETAAHFPPGRCQVSGVPIRAEFFAVPPRVRGEWLNVLITGGSQGSRTLNRAFRESWPLFRAWPGKVRFVHQSGQRDHAEWSRDFAASGVVGQVEAFIGDMPAAFASADLVVGRAGASAVAELAAAGKPSILVPFPHAADDHQARNADAMRRVGAARMVADRDLTGARLFDEIRGLAEDPAALERMARAARAQARPDAARAAADALEACAAIDTSGRKPKQY